MISFDVAVFRWLNSLVFLDPPVGGWIDAWIVFKAVFLGWWILVILFLLAVFSSQKKFWTKAIIFSLTSGAVSRFIFTEAIRFFYNRPRPFEVLENINQLIFHSSGGSFPSGHAAFFFAVAASIFFFHRTWGIIFFGMALYMGIGRIEVGVHWPTDILGGMAVGIFSAWVVRKIVKRATK